MFDLRFSSYVDSKMPPGTAPAKKPTTKAASDRAKFFALSPADQKRAIEFFKKAAANKKHQGAVMGAHGAPQPTHKFAATSPSSSSTKPR